MERGHAELGGGQDNGRPRTSTGAGCRLATVATDSVLVLHAEKAGFKFINYHNRN